MIEKKTVFVLGAGAHCSYGFPSGETLISQVVSRVETFPNSLDGISISSPQSPDYKEFVESLRNSGHASIDAFLNANKHRPGYDRIGKAAIAQILLEYESKEPAVDDDWLAYLFKVMLDGASSPEDFERRNQIGFVTFNYDRFLEKWLFRKLKYSFGIDDKRALQGLKHFPIQHVYGSLGPFPRPDNQRKPLWVPAMDGIRTIFDAEHDADALKAAKDLLKDAHVLCLLGFGFHRENIDILELGSIAPKCSGVVASSRYGISDTEWDRLSKPLHMRTIEKWHYDQRCLGTLRNLPIF